MFRQAIEESPLTPLASIFIYELFTRPVLLLLAVLSRAIPSPVPPGLATQGPLTSNEMPGREDLVTFLGSQWHLLKMVGHQLRNRIGGARKDEIENILEFNRY